jgi:uncharacterized membrane protein
MDAERMQAARPAKPTLARQRGAAVVETAVTAALFLLLLFAVVEFGRYMLTWNAASEATRLAARAYAASCAKDGNTHTRISDSVRNWGGAAGYDVPQSWLEFKEQDCVNGDDCKIVQVSIKQPTAACSDGTALVGRLILPGLSDIACIPIPAFTHAAIRESSDSTCN